jgi:signal peptidase I
VFHFPNGPDTDYIKRIVGLPEDRIEIRPVRATETGTDRVLQVHINGVQLDEPYISESLPENCQEQVERWGRILCDGDNRTTAATGSLPVSRKSGGEVVFRISATPKASLI